MNIKLPCEIVQDLLPAYLDNLTNEITNNAIHEHLKTCNDCEMIMKHMQEPYPEISEKPCKEEIDNFKKARKKTRLSSLIAVISVLVMLIMGVLHIFYTKGSSFLAESVECDVIVSGRNLTITGTSFDSGVNISKIEFKESDNGIITISFRTLIGISSYNNDFQSSYTAKHAITQVRLENRILWDQGKTIAPNVSAAYLAKHDSATNLTANSNSWIALDANSILGSFITELHVSQEPHGWNVILENEVGKTDQQIVEQYMKSYAYILLATIDDLGYVSYEYTTESGKLNLTVTSEDATSFAGNNIKTYANSPSRLQELMVKSGL